MSPLCYPCNNAQISFQVPIRPRIAMPHFSSTGTIPKQSDSGFRWSSTDFLDQRITATGSKVVPQWSFVGGSRDVIQQKSQRFIPPRKICVANASWLLGPQFASNVFTFGTAAVLPFYTLMVLAPNAALTKRTMESSIPHVMIGTLYAYLLYLSWTPETMKLLFATEYWLPELSGIAKMFSSEMTLASAWLHLLAVDLFAARHIFHDGLKNKIETRHSISLCLLCCPIGIVTHAITKFLIRLTDNRK